MFDTLADHIRHDEGPPPTIGERLLRWGMVALVLTVLFGGLYLLMPHLS